MALTLNVGHYYDMPREVYNRHLLEAAGESYEENRQVCQALATAGEAADAGFE